MMVMAGQAASGPRWVGWAAALVALLAVGAVMLGALRLGCPVLDPDAAWDATTRLRRRHGLILAVLGLLWLLWQAPARMALRWLCGIPVPAGPPGAPPPLPAGTLVVFCLLIGLLAFALLLWFVAQACP